MKDPQYASERASSTNLIGAAEGLDGPRQSTDPNLVEQDDPRSWSLDATSTGANEIWDG
jgi:hypothetical protein